MDLSLLHQQIQQIANSVKINRKLKTKVWIYEDRLVCLDFTDNYIRLAVDFTLVEDKIKSNIVYRNEYSKKLLEKVIDRSVNKVFSYDDVVKITTGIIERIDVIYSNLYDYGLSVIVPVYNRESSIVKLLESLCKQTIDKNKFEVIFIDDASTDNVVKVIDQTLKKTGINYRILQLPQNSGGASIPRNLGIRASKGEYVFFVDSDDALFPWTLSHSWQFIEEHDPDVLYVKVVSATGKRIKNVASTFLVGNVVHGDFWYHHYARVFLPSKIIRSHLIKFHDISFPNMKTGEDRYFLTECLAHARKVSTIADKPMYDLSDFDDLSLALNNKTEPTVIHSKQYQDLVGIVFKSPTLDYVNKLKLFHGLMSRVYDKLERDIESNKNIDEDIEEILKLTAFHGAILVKDMFYSRHIKIYDLLKQKDSLGVVK